MSRPNSLGPYRSAFYPIIAQIAADPQSSYVLNLSYGKALELRRRFYHMRGLLARGQNVECQTLAPFAEQLHIQIKTPDGKSPVKGTPGSAAMRFVVTHDCIFDAELAAAQTSNTLFPGIPSASEPRVHIIELIRQIMTPVAYATPPASTQGSGLVDSIAAQTRDFDRRTAQEESTKKFDFNNVFRKGGAASGESGAAGKVDYAEIPLDGGDSLKITRS
jgi:hypothetical protein